MKNQAMENMTFESKLSLIIAGVALLFSIVSPIFSAWIQGYYQTKVKKIDANLEIARQNQQFYDVHRAHVIESHIKAAGPLIAMETSENEAAYNSAMGEMYLYADKDLRPMMKRLHTNIMDNENDAALAVFVELRVSLSSKEVRKKHEVWPCRADNRAPCGIWLKRQWGYFPVKRETYGKHGDQHER